MKNVEEESRNYSVDLTRDDSVAGESAMSMSDDQNKNNSTTSRREDKNVLRSKNAAFVILGLAAVGLGFMTFFLTRGEEIADFEEEVSWSFEEAFALNVLL